MTKVVVKSLYDADVEEYDKNGPSADIAGYQDKDLVRIPVDSLMVTAVPFQTYALMVAQSNPDTNTVYVVTNDPDTTLINPPLSNNARYTWISGTNYLRAVATELENQVAENTVNIATNITNIETNQEQIRLTKMLALAGL